MKKFNFGKNIKLATSKMKFKIKAKSPEILIVAGVVGVVASTIMACKATTKLSGILEEGKDKIEKIHEYADGEERSEDYSDKDMNKDVLIVGTQTALKVAKLYAPSVVMSAVSITAIVKSHNILTKRNAALTAAYTAIDKSFKEYRGRVVDRFGAELDKELKYNLVSKEVETETIDEKGNPKTVKNTVNTTNVEGYSDYAKFFDESCPNWKSDPEYNQWFVKAQERYANDKLKRDGYLFLNDVYKMLGIEPTQAGQVVGWVADPADEEGDGYVTFGIYDVYKDANRRFVNGLEPTILLDFNVDGVIIDKM